MPSSSRHAEGNRRQRMYAHRSHIAAHGYNHLTNIDQMSVVRLLYIAYTLRVDVKDEI